MRYQQHRDTLRLEDLKGLKPGDWISPVILSQEHWAGVDQEDNTYAGRLNEAKTFIENYFLACKEDATKVLCVQRNSGIAITVGAESSSILSNRAVNAVKRLTQTSKHLDEKVDVRFMTPDQVRRHEVIRRRVQLQQEALEHAKVKHSSEQEAVKQTAVSRQRLG